MSEATQDPLQFGEEEVSPTTEKVPVLGATEFGDAVPTIEADAELPTSTAPSAKFDSATPLTDVSDEPSTPVTGFANTDPTYPEVAPFNNQGKYGSYDVSDTMYSQALSEDNSELQRRDSDFVDYPEGPAISLAQSHVHILVSDPVKRMGPSPVPGVNEPYMTYLVTTKCSLSSFLPSESAVRRRFKDVVALGNLLKMTQKGYFIPPRPEKNPVQGKKMDAKFVETRRRAIERYLNVLGLHSVIGKSEEFKCFLSLEGDLRSNPEWLGLSPARARWHTGVTKLFKQMVGQQKTIPDPSEVTQSTGKSQDLVRMVKEGVQLHRNRKQGGGEFSGEELQLRSDRTLIEECRKQLNESAKRSEIFSRRFKRLMDSFGGLGIAFTQVGKYEDEQRYVPGEEIRLVAEACAEVYNKGERAYQNGSHQLQLFYHYRHFMPSVLEALAVREGALLTLQTLESDTTAKKAKLEELAAPSKMSLEARQKRQANLQDDLEALKAATESANSEYERIKLRNQQDMTQLRKQQELEFMDMLVKFSQVQETFWSSASSAWKQLAKELGATSADLN